MGPKPGLCYGFQIWVVGSNHGFKDWIVGSDPGLWSKPWVMGLDPGSWVRDLSSKPRSPMGWKPELLMPESWVMGSILVYGLPDPEVQSPGYGPEISMMDTPDPGIWVQDCFMDSWILGRDLCHGLPGLGVSAS
ncbi:hypothetical protein QAD02_017288 [Eretmocerus hayati]|uniref:Uncharacterized protein n=1 Tax=Eretmocerus hayati TaxID=131215 RepID=A0ACC2PER1_9HYME|nr:hypothetical protein QAD02_017288 [Eretmocerus hayati]